MSNKTRNLLKLLSVIIVVICVLMELGIVQIKRITQYVVWMMVIAFGMLLISSR